LKGKHVLKPTLPRLLEKDGRRPAAVDRQGKLDLGKDEPVSGRADKERVHRSSIKSKLKGKNNFSAKRVTLVSGKQQGQVDQSYGETPARRGTGGGQHPPKCEPRTKPTKTLLWEKEGGYRDPQRGGPGDVSRNSSRGNPLLSVGKTVPWYTKGREKGNNPRKEEADARPRTKSQVTSVTNPGGGNPVGEFGRLRGDHQRSSAAKKKTRTGKNCLEGGKNLTIIKG